MILACRTKTKQLLHYLSGIQSAHFKFGMIILNFPSRFFRKDRWKYYISDNEIYLIKISFVYCLASRLIDDMHFLKLFIHLTEVQFNFCIDYFSHCNILITEFYYSSILLLRILLFRISDDNFSIFSWTNLRLNQ